MAAITICVILLVSLGFSNALERCDLGKLPTLLNGQYVISVDRLSILYFCNEDYHFANFPGNPNARTIVYCNDNGTWEGQPSECVKTPCKPNPCLNGGVCRTGEDPFNTGYTCFCGPNVGGTRCQVVNPCSTCPPETASCVITYAHDDGRFCYDVNVKLVGSTSS